jgi:hypothetical protein
MARAPRDPTITDTQEPDTEAPAQPRPGDPPDVLVYIDRAGPIACNWYGAPESRAAGQALIPTNERVRLEPGLSFCPGRLWARVRETSTWTLRVEQGAAKALAGHGGDLVREWQALKTAALVTKIEKSHHLPTLVRLKEMEAGAAAPRLQVAEAIDAQLATMKAKLEAHTEARTAKRRANRRASRL